MTEGGSGNGPEQVSSSVAMPLKVIRVKRKRQSDAPEDLVIEDLIAPKKKQHGSISDALQGLGLHATKQPLDTGSRHHRFRKLVTLTPKELANTNPSHLKEILSNPLEVPGTKGKKRDATDANLPDKNFAGNDDTDKHLRRGVRYEQVCRRRGLTNFELTEGASDPLRGLATTLYDVVRMDKNVSNLCTDDGVEEDALLCNYLPMVREYLNTSSKDAADVVEVDADGDYVYDLYIEDMETSGSESDIWWEAHRRGACPVVQIVDDGTWLVVETSDIDDSYEDSEDSNAEGFIGNDYPDEEEDTWTSDGSEKADGGGRCGKREWFEDSD